MVAGGSTCAHFRKSLEAIRESRSLRLAVVFTVLLLDSTLLTAVVPIIPKYLLVLDGEDKTKDLMNGQTIRPDVEPTPTPTTPNWTDLTSGYNETRELYVDIYEKENSKVGWLLSSKAIVQLLVNPVIGPLINRVGYSVPMTVGILVTLTSTLLYAFGESYPVLFAARTVHGIGSSCTTIAGLAMLAEVYPDDKERSRAMGISLGGLALGVLLGYPFGGVMYQFVGKMQLFLVIGGLLLVQQVVQIWAMKPYCKMQNLPKGTPLSVLLRDTYIVVASGAIMFPEMSMAILESTLSIWLMETIKPEEWQLGMVFVPDSVGYWIGCNVFGVVSLKLGRWRVAMLAMLMNGLSLFCVPLATRIVHLFVPHFCIGISLGMADASMLPLLALLVDTRHSADYGTVYAIVQVAISLGFAIGPAFGGQLVKWIGFTWLLRGMAILNIMYTPLCYLLRNPPDKSAGLTWNDELPVYDTMETETFSYRQLN